MFVWICQSSSAISLYIFMSFIRHCKKKKYFTYKRRCKGCYHVSKATNERTDSHCLMSAKKQLAYWLYELGLLIYVCARAHTHTHTYTHTHTHTHTHTQTHTLTHAHDCTQNARTHTHTHAHTHIYTHTYI